MTPEALRALYDCLKPDLDAHASPWALIGSGALLLNGAPLEGAADLDVVTSVEGARALRRAWADWLTPGEAKAPDGPFRSDDFARYVTPWGPVEVMGGLRVTQSGVMVPLEVDGGPVPPPRELLRILRLFGRPKDLAKAALVEAWLAAG